MIIASSTTMPNTMIKPNKLIKFIVTGNGPTGINHKAPKNAIGIPTTAQNATFIRRNNESTIKTKNAPWAIFFVIISRRSWR